MCDVCVHSYIGRGESSFCHQPPLPPSTHSIFPRYSIGRAFSRKWLYCHFLFPMRCQKMKRRSSLWSSFIMIVFFSLSFFPCVGWIFSQPFLLGFQVQQQQISTTTPVSLSIQKLPIQNEKKTVPSTTVVSLFSCPVGTRSGHARRLGAPVCRWTCIFSSSLVTQRDAVPFVSFVSMCVCVWELVCVCDCELVCSVLLYNFVLLFSLRSEFATLFLFCSVLPSFDLFL